MLNLSKAVTVRDLLVYGIVMATLRAYPVRHQDDPALPVA